MTDREQLLDQLRPVSFAIAYQMLGSVSEAEDVVQEALLRIHQAMETGEQIASPRAYVATVTTRLAINELHSALARTLCGRSRVSRMVIGSLLSTRVPGMTVRPVEVNGGPGALYLDGQERLIAVVALDIVGGQITRINGVVNPDKLAHLGPVGDFTSLWSSTR